MRGIWRITGGKNANYIIARQFLMDQTVRAAVLLSITALPLCVIERPWSGTLEKWAKGLDMDKSSLTK
jgi:hypothetical protein